jgi:molecular chaperone DnaJ
LLRLGGKGGTTFQYGDMSDFGDIFSSLFGDSAGGAGMRRGAQRGQDVESPIEVTLEEAYRGSARVMHLESQELCPACGGTGIVGNRVCAMCGGGGAKATPRRLEVKIPAGVKDGSRIRIATEGGAGRGKGDRGDLYLVVRILPHKLFERRGDDLYTEVSVPLAVAMLGGEVTLSSLNGRLCLKIPAETQNSRVFRLAEKGMPKLGSAGRGSMFAKVKVVLPTGLSEEERRLFERLRSLRAA